VAVRSPVEAVEKLGQSTLLYAEALRELRRRRWEDYISAILFIVTILMVMRSYGVVVTPEMIVQWLKGIAIGAPKLVQIVGPYVFHFYNLYILVSMAMPIFLSRWRTYLPEWLYVLDSIVLSVCGLIYVAYTGDYAYYLFVAIGFAEMLLLPKLREMKVQFVATAMRASQYGVSPMITHREARELGIPEEFIQQMIVLPEALPRAGEERTRTEQERGQETAQTRQRRSVPDVLLKALARIPVSRVR